MNDEVVVTPVVVPPVVTEVEKKKRRSRDTLSVSQAAELEEADAVRRAAEKSAYAKVLTEHEIDATLVDRLKEKITGCRSTSADAAQSTTGRITATKDNTSTRSKMLLSVRSIQSAARQKYADTNPEVLKDYAVGVKLTNVSHATLSAHVAAILEKLTTDKLPGVTSEKIALLSERRDAWLESKGEQTGSQADATTRRSQRDELLSEARKLKRTIQFAAESAWPFGTDGVKGIREEFRLPSNRPYTG